MKPYNEIIQVCPICGKVDIDNTHKCDNFDMMRLEEKENGY